MVRSPPPVHRRPNHGSGPIWSGPRPLSAILPAVSKAALRSRSPALAMLAADWDAVVGPALARVSLPLKFAAGTLTIGCDGPTALELQHVTEPLLARINAHLGGSALQRLRFVRAEPPEMPEAPRPTTPIRLDPATVASLPEGALGAALSALGKAMLAQRDQR